MYFNVSFKHSESIYCSNIAKAETLQDVEAHYSAKYEWFSISEASAHDVEDAERRGKPIIKIDHVEETKAEETKEDTTTETTETTTEQADAKGEALTIAYRIMSQIMKQEMRSAWMKGVKGYAVDLMHGIIDQIADGWLKADIFADGKALDEAMRSGAEDWVRYSEGGCALIYDSDIAFALCTPSELKRTDDGNKPPRKGMTWIKLQAYALEQASAMVCKVLSQIKASGQM